MRAQRDYYETWLAKLRKELAISGRKSELCLHLQKTKTYSPQDSHSIVTNIIEGDQRADLDAVLEIDQWRAIRKKAEQNDLQTELKLTD